MKIALLLALIMSSMTLVHAKNKPRCKANYNLVSCEGIEGAQRGFFCAKREIDDKKKASICAKPKKKTRKLSKSAS